MPALQISKNWRDVYHFLLFRYVQNAKSWVAYATNLKETDLDVTLAKLDISLQAYRSSGRGGWCQISRLNLFRNRKLVKLGRYLFCTCWFFFLMRICSLSELNWFWPWGHFGVRQFAEHMRMILRVFQRFKWFKFLPHQKCLVSGVLLVGFCCHFWWKSKILAHD